MENRVNVAHYISELLFRHDCVVVTGLGSFVCTYAPARIHPAQHTFTPPAKQIVFNKHLQQNDGLLAQTIATETNVSFETAMLSVKQFGEEVFAELKTGKRVELHNIGTLYFDPEKNTCFEAFPEINYLIDSFGLGSFQSMPILREAAPVVEKKQPVVIPVVKEEKEEAKVIALPVEAPNRRRRTLVAAAIILPFLIIAALFFTSQNNNGIAGFGFFGKKEPSKYLPVKWIKSVPEEKIVAPLEADPNGIAKLVLADNAPAIIVDIHKPIPDCTRVDQPVRNGKSVYAKEDQGKLYYIIAGAFSVPENAERFRKQFDLKGYNTVVLERNDLKHIALSSFKSKEEAENFLFAIRGDIPAAWVLKK
jgi:hypothetical protein